MPSRSFVSFDPLTILTRLREVEFLVVGGFAAVLYGSPTVTGDLDILPLASPENVRRLADALVGMKTVVREPRATGRRLPVTEDLLRQTADRSRQGGQILTLTSAGPVDILWRLHDGRSYLDLVVGSVLLEEDDLRVRVIGLDELIAVKASIGRPQDRLVLPYLEEIRRRR